MITLFSNPFITSQKIKQYMPASSKIRTTFRHGLLSGKLTFAPQKCQVINISNKRESNHLPLPFNDITIIESSIKITIDQKLNWASHINTMVTRPGQRQTYVLKIHSDYPQTYKSGVEYCP